LYVTNWGTDTPKSSKKEERCLALACPKTPTQAVGKVVVLKGKGTPTFREGQFLQGGDDEAGGEKKEATVSAENLVLREKSFPWGG